MNSDQRKPSDEHAAELTQLLTDLRAGEQATVLLFKEVNDLSSRTAYAEKGARERAMNESPPAEMVPERQRLNETYDQYTTAIERCCAIWESARKPIIKLGMLSDRSTDVLREFRRLPEYPNALDFRRCVEFLEIIVEAGLADLTVERYDDVKPEDAKKPRGRPVEIPEERKAAALKLKRNGGTNLAAAKILYADHQPSKRQRDNVHAILAAYCKKYGLDGGMN